MYLAATINEQIATLLNSNYKMQQVFFFTIIVEFLHVGFFARYEDTEDSRHMLHSGADRVVAVILQRDV